MSGSIDLHEHEWENTLLIMSNLFYLLPLALAFKKDLRCKLHLVILFATVIIISSEFHACRGSNADDTHVETRSSLLSFLSGKDVRYSSIKAVDYVVATFTMVSLLLCVTPLRSSSRLTISVLTILWLAAFVSSDNLFLFALPLLPCLLLFVCTLQAFDNTASGQKAYHMWMLAAIIFVICIICFFVNHEKYWLFHSAWHVLGALSAAILIMYSQNHAENLIKDKVQSSWILHE